MSIEIQADIEFKLDEMVDCAAAKMAAISNPLQMVASQSK